MTPNRPLDASVLRDAMFLFHQALREHRDELNSLNVYPVPDGDTGTNMLLTQQAVRDELSRMEDGSLPDVAGAIARSSLIGARGNSGVILAQALRGLTDELAAGGDAVSLARGLRRAADEAFRAVARPVKGTVLDVLAEAAAGAERAANQDADPSQVTAAALERSRDALARTREDLVELRRSGVVDAGGRGAVLLFDALHAAVTGTGLSEEVGAFGPVGRNGTTADAAASHTDYKYEVQYLLELVDDDAPSIRSELAEIGDSVVVVGGGGTYKVHVHTNDPDRAVGLGGSRGTQSSISVTDLEGDIDRCLAGQARGVRTAEEQATALVAVADGEGLERILASLGALVVRGGPGNNPSVGAIVSAIRAAPSDDVALLPNHRNVLPAAERAAAESAKDVRVIPAVSIPQGIAAAAAFHPDVAVEDNEKALIDAAEACTWAEVARAVRDADTPAGLVREGEYLGFVGERAVIAGPDADSIAVDLVARLRAPRHEILTVFGGEDVSEEVAERLGQRLRETFSGLEVEVARGDQSGYPYLIGLE